MRSWSSAGRSRPCCATDAAVGYRPSKVAFLAHHAWGDRCLGSWPDLIPEGRRNEYSLSAIKGWRGVFLARFETSQFKRSSMPDAPTSRTSAPGRRRGRVHPFLDHDGPIAFAHRGGAGEAPENTLPAFEVAIGLGYRYLETDAHVTRDGVVVAFHDACLDRVTDRTGAIAELQIAEVEAADAGYKFSQDGGRSFPFRRRGVRVPRVAELLRRWPQARLNIDPKTDGCILPLLALVDRLDAWDRVCIGSFSDRRLRRVRILSRMRACTSMGPRAVAIARAASTVGMMPRQGADCIQVPPRRGAIPLVSARFVRAAHRAGLPVHVWTINDEQTMHELLDLGVDAIMSDRAHLLAEVFTSRRLDLAGGRGERSRGTA